MIALDGTGLSSGDPGLSPRRMEEVAERFRVLGEPARLRILETLRRGERSVSGLAEATGLGVANVSRHLSLLHATHFVKRRKEGIQVLYSLDDPRVFELCDIMCGKLDEELERAVMESAGGEGSG